MDPNTPVIVGISQLNNKSNDAAEPIAMMTATTESALVQSGIAAGSIQAVRVVGGIWPYRDPGRLVADRIGATSARTSITPIGGNEVFDLVIDTSAKIQRGELDAAVICAAEALRTRRRDHRAGQRSHYLTEAEGAEPDERKGSARPTSSAREDEVGIGTSAVAFYSLVESAIRHRRGEDPAAHRYRIADLWHRANEVAQANPHAWIQDPLTTAQIATPSPTNRMVSDPYPKLMTSNVNVDQSAAVVVVSAAVAERSGIPRDQWVFPHAGVGAHDHWLCSNRWTLDESPAMRLAAGRALELAGTNVDGCRFIDLYSCFPAAVQVAQRELDIAPDRDFTITGGLTFAGGPLNCYCMLSLVRSVELLRENPGDSALITGNGGFFTKHSFVVMGTEPPQGGFGTDSVQASVDQLPSRQALDLAPVSATIEAYTVNYDREGRPHSAIMSCLGPDGGRWWASTEDAGLCEALIRDDHCGDSIQHVGGAVALR